MSIGADKYLMRNLLLLTEIARTSTVAQNMQKKGEDDDEPEDLLVDVSINGITSIDVTDCKHDAKDVAPIRIFLRAQ